MPTSDEPLEPLVDETRESILGRMLVDLNVGAMPGDAAFWDTIPGGFMHDALSTVSLMFEREYDTIGTELVAACLPSRAFESYLDDHGDGYGVPRNDPAYASGVLQLTGTPGAAIPAGLLVAVPASSAEQDPLEYVTQAGGTLDADGVLEVPVIATTAGAASNAPAGAIELLIATAENPAPDVQSLTNPAPIANGTDVEEDPAYRARLLEVIELPVGAGNNASLRRAALDIDGVADVEIIPQPDGAGTVRMILAGTDGPLSAEAIADAQATIDPFTFTTELSADVTLPAASIPLVATDGLTPHHGIVLIDDQFIRYSTRTPTSLEGCEGGQGAIATGTAVHGLGSGEGAAAPGEHVDVVSAQIVLFDATLVLQPEVGWRVGGNPASSVRDAEPDVRAAVTAYVAQLGAGDDPIAARISAAAIGSPGIHDVLDVQLNGVEQRSVAIPDSLVARLGQLTITQGTP